MIRKLRPILVMGAMLSAILLSGCAVLAIPVIYLINAGDGEKDVSADFQRGHVVGKDYETLKDLYLTQYIYSNNMELSYGQILTTKFKDGVAIESPCKEFPTIKVVPKGTRFRVCAVTVYTNYGSESYLKRILANFIDENGTIINQANLNGKTGPFNVRYLFESKGLEPNEKWIILPNSNWIRESAASNRFPE